MQPERLDAVVARVMARLEPLVREAMSAELQREAEPISDDLLDQHASPVGPRHHIRIARKLIERGAPGAARVGRRYLIRRAVLAVELEALGRSREALGVRAQAGAEGPAAELRRELALLQGGRR